MNDKPGDCFDRYYRWGKHWGQLLSEVGNDNQKFRASLADDELTQLLTWLKYWEARIEKTIEQRTKDPPITRQEASREATARMATTTDG